MSNWKAIRDGLLAMMAGYALWSMGVWFGLLLIMIGALLALVGANPKPPTGV